MPHSYFEHAEEASKRLYLVFGMAKWASWMDSSNPIYVAYAAVPPGTMDLIYQVAFTAYATLHVVKAVRSSRSDRGS